MNQIKLNELIRRKLEDTYFIVYAIRNEINIRKGDFIEKTDVYSLVGVDKRGYRQLLNIYQDRINNNHFWLDCFEGLKSRGLRNILFLAVGDNKNMKKTAKIAFPSIVFVDSLTDISPRFYKYTSERSGKNTTSKIKELYIQNTLKDYQSKMVLFKEKYNNIIHQKLIDKYLKNIENMYKYSKNIRELLFKHTANMLYYDRIRLTFTDKKYIDTLEDIFSELNEELYKYFGYTSFNKREWTLILNDLIQIYPEMELI